MEAGGLMEDETNRAMTIGDLKVVGRPSGKLMKALAVIATVLHQEYARQGALQHADMSKESCVLSSLTVREFLVAIGFTRAEIRPVCVKLWAMRGGNVLHALGIGVPGPEDKPGRWNGHMVVSIPEEGWIIDTTMYPCDRQVWAGLWPGMIALPERPEFGGEDYGLKTATGVGFEFEAEGKLRQSEEPWLEAPRRASAAPARAGRQGDG
jgi:hypothetical protein